MINVTTAKTRDVKKLTLSKFMATFEVSFLCTSLTPMLKRDTIHVPTMEWKIGMTLYQKL